VGTGIERVAAIDSGTVVTATRGGLLTMSMQPALWCV
jgi:hypothetical protein